MNLGKLEIYRDWRGGTLHCTKRCELLQLLKFLKLFIPLKLPKFTSLPIFLKRPPPFPAAILAFMSEWCSSGADMRKPRMGE